MAIGLGGVCMIVAIILFILAVVPPTEPYRGRLMCVGLAFMAAGHLL